jgi:hypothetical protein
MEGTPQYSLNTMLGGPRTGVDVFEKTSLAPPRHQTQDWSDCFEIQIWYVPEESDESHKALGLGLLIEIWTQGLLNTKVVCFSVDMTFDLFLQLKTNPIGKVCLAKTNGI